MKLYAICLVKNEDDVIGQTLTYATRYCDRIYVIDNGSTDDTWKIVQSLARDQDKIIPFEQTLLPYSNGLRARAYNSAHRELSDDDWWLIQDSDEFLAEEPKPFIEIAARKGADIIRAWQIQFYYTERDLLAWENGTDKRDRQIFERRRYYQINWQEPRLFRNQRNRLWDVRVNDTIPDGLRKVFGRRILNRHYQFRDPEQIEKRLRLRFGHPTSFRYVTSTDWKTTLRESYALDFHREGEPWRFGLRGLAYYYRRTAFNTIRAKYRGALRRLRRLFGMNGVSAS